MDLRVVGIYPVDAREPTHLVELAVAECAEALDVGRITQESSSTPRENWQVPWDEHFLDVNGASLPPAGARPARLAFLEYEPPHG